MVLKMVQVQAACPKGLDPDRVMGLASLKARGRRSMCNPGRARGKSRISGTDRMAILCLELDIVVRVTCV